jgi:peptide/nickel transport system substrate-binding protein
MIEGLYKYDLSDPDMPLIPWLAVDGGTWLDSTHFQVDLRQNVQFHDGTIMDADDVVFSFNRMLYFLNASGTLPTGVPLMEPAMLYQLPDGVTPIIQSVVADDADTVTFTLNAPYAIFKKILGYPSAFILSDASVPATERATFDDPVVGTGPFRYMYFTAGTEVRYERFNNYWGENAYFDVVVHALINNPTTRNNAMLTHDIDILFDPISSLLDIFDDDPTIVYYQRGSEWGGPGLSYAYLGMNNHLINETWRSAISFAYDYDYMIEEIKQDTVLRAYSPLAPAFLPGFDQMTLDIPVHNVTRAREYMVSMGFGDMGWSDAQWEAQAASSPFRTFNYTYNLGSSTREPIYPMLLDNLADIGVGLDDAGMSWDDFLLRLYGQVYGFDALELYFVGWGPDYLDPFNMLAPLFSNISSSNSAQVNDHELEMWFIDVLAETDDVARTAIYEDILTKIVEVIRPHCFGYHSKGNYVHSADLQDRSYNAMGNWWAYPIWRNTTTSAALGLPRGTVGHTPPPWAGTVGP